MFKKSVKQGSDQGSVERSAEKSKERQVEIECDESKQSSIYKLSVIPEDKPHGKNEVHTGKPYQLYHTSVYRITETKKGPPPPSRPPVNWYSFVDKINKSIDKSSDPSVPEISEKEKIISPK